MKQIHYSHVLNCRRRWNKPHLSSLQFFLAFVKDWHKYYHPGLYKVKRAKLKLSLCLLTQGEVKANNKANFSSNRATLVDFWATRLIWKKYQGTEQTSNHKTVWRMWIWFKDSKRPKSWRVFFIGIRPVPGQVILCVMSSLFVQALKGKTLREMDGLMVKIWRILLSLFLAVYSLGILCYSFSRIMWP